MNFYKRAIELKNETIENRRYIHKNAEIGLELPTTKEYVVNKLKEYGLSPVKCGKGITAVVGSGEPVILLRADMDALPMKELSGETFASVNENTAHTCGHDFHTAMLLTAAKILKEHENKLCGTVKLMFQPGEEILEGCKNMIENGVLKHPKPDAALAFHVAAGNILPGTFMYNSNNVMMSSVDNFKIEIKGKGGHGAYPNLTVDPINIAVKIYSGLESILAREANPEKRTIITIGKINGGTAGNIIPDTAILEGTLRTNNEEEREKLKQRIIDISKDIAQAFNGEAKASFLAEIPSLKCQRDFTEKIIGYINELNIPHKKFIPDMQASASEDFALIAEKISSAYVYLSAGFDDERGKYFAHNPKVRFNEDVCPIGSAAMVQSAVRWLEDKKGQKK